MLRNFVGVLFDGLAYGSLLFLISNGLSVTLGLMNFVNLAHGAFAMLGAYTCLALQRRGVPFLLALPAAFLAAAVAGAVLERALFRRLYRAPQLDQVLFSIGITFMAVATATWLFGPGQQGVPRPDLLVGRMRILGVDLGRYQLFLILLVVVITALLESLVVRTRFGAQVRAAVDNRAAAEGLGIDVGRVFSVTFALGTGLAGLGGALAIDLLGLDPTFALKYLIYFLLAVTVGGPGSARGTAAAALLLGVFDIAGKYYVPDAGAFIIYALMVVLLLLFPKGLYGRRA
ncbi:MAG TPA: branched-chain amino acid ABC transporter permease [Myxococcales bacterium]|nr:branched-chain amino acid ABC transporter permease [Myxococcales bacterium]